MQYSLKLVLNWMQYYADIDFLAVSSFCHGLQNITIQPYQCEC